MTISDLSEIVIGILSSPMFPYTHHFYEISCFLHVMNLSRNAVVFPVILYVTPARLDD